MAADDCADAVIITTNDAEIRMVNGAAARLTGLSTREMQALTLWDITHSASQADFDVLWKEFLRSGRQRGGFPLRHRHGDDAPPHLSYSVCITFRRRCLLRTVLKFRS